jgi:hypothetical protein
VVTKPNTADEGLLVRYLLGRVDPQEQERIEQRYLTEPEFHEELKAAERDLIDQYVHGELPDPEEFERQFLTSPQRRQKVEFARALQQSLGAPSLAEAGAVRNLAPPTSGSAWAWRLAAATVLVAIGAALLVTWQGRVATNRIAETMPPQPAPGVSTPAPNSGTGAETPSRPGAPAVRVATFVLVPSLTRDGDETRTLAIAPGVDVRLQLTLEPGDYDTYRVDMRTADGDEIWREDGLRTIRTSSGDAVVITVPGARLSDQDYTVRVSGVSARREGELAASYYFRVRRK